MKRPRYKPAARVYPDIKVPASKFSAPVIFVLRLAVRFYLFSFIGGAKVRLETPSPLIDAFRRALGGESRCIVAFRHPYGFEPQLLTWFVLFALKRIAARQGAPLPSAPRMRFVYGYEVLRWGGRIVRLVMPRLGCLPVHHAKLDSRGLAAIYDAVARGPYPVGIAPEGQVSYTSGGIPRLEPGIIRIGMRAAARLAEEGNALPVEILPVSMRFSYGRGGERAAEALLRKVEKLCGAGSESGGAGGLAERFLNCREIIMRVNEKRYGISAGPGLPWDGRAAALLKAALDCCAGILGVRDDRTEHFDRLYYLRQVCWDRIFLPGEEAKTEIALAVEDLRAGEAWHAARHMEMADFTWYFRGPPPGEDAPLPQRVEYVQNLWDFANRTMGGAYANRVNIHPRLVTIQAGPAVNLSAALGEYRRDRKGTVRRLLSRLGEAYRELAEGPGPPDHPLSGDPSHHSVERLHTMV